MRETFRETVGDIERGREGQRERDIGRETEGEE